MSTETTRCTIYENDMNTVPNFYYTMYNGSVTIRFRWPLPTPFYEIYNRDKAQTVLPPTLLHFVQPSFQPYRNCRPGMCWSYHKRVKSVQNPLVTLGPPFAMQPKNSEPQKSQEHILISLVILRCPPLLPLASTSFPLYMSCWRVQVSHPFTKWTLGSHQLNSTCSWLNQQLATLVGQVSNVVCIRSLVPCAVLYTSPFAVSKCLLPRHLSNHVRSAHTCNSRLSSHTRCFCQPSPHCPSMPKMPIWVCNSLTPRGPLRHI